MDVWRITVAALRRWYVFLPLLALTAFVALRVGDAAPTHYEVSTTAILVPGPVPTEASGPYGSRSDTTQVISIVLDGTAARGELEARGLNPEYEVDSRDRSALLNITVLGETEQEGLATSEAVLDLAREELAQRQAEAGVPQGAQIGVQVLQTPFLSDVIAEGKLRNMAIVGIVGASLSLLLAVLCDDLVGLFKRGLRRWRVRHDAAPGTGTTASPTPQRGLTEEVPEPTPSAPTPSSTAEHSSPPSTAARRAPSLNGTRPSDLAQVGPGSDDDSHV